MPTTVISRNLTPYEVHCRAREADGTPCANAPTRYLDAAKKRTFYCDKHGPRDPATWDRLVRLPSAPALALVEDTPAPAAIGDDLDARIEAALARYGIAPAAPTYDENGVRLLLEELGVDCLSAAVETARDWRTQIAQADDLHRKYLGTNDPEHVALALARLVNRLETATQVAERERQAAAVARTEARKQEQLARAAQVELERTRADLAAAEAVAAEALDGLPAAATPAIEAPAAPEPAPAPIAAHEGNGRVSEPPPLSAEQRAKMLSRVSAIADRVRAEAVEHVEHEERERPRPLTAFLASVQRAPSAPAVTVSAAAEKAYDRLDHAAARRVQTALRAWLASPATVRIDHVAQSGNRHSPRRHRGADLYGFRAGSLYVLLDRVEGGYTIAGFARSGDQL